MPQTKEQIKRKAQKVVDNAGNTALAHLDATLELADKMGEVVAAIKDIPKTEIPEPQLVDLTETNKLLSDLTEEIKKKEQSEEVTYSIDSVAREKLRGEKGDSYVLTKKDKQEIARSIDVPVIEKVIEKTEVIIKEISPDTRLEIVTKINTGKKNDLKIEASQITNLPKAVTNIINEGAHGGAYETPIKDSTTGRLLNKDSSGAWLVNSSSIVGITGTKAQFNTALTDGDFLFSDSFVHNEIPAGTINSVNKIFTTANNFVTNSTHLYLNGLRQTIGVGSDYTESAQNQITFTDAPIPGDIIIIDYTKS